MSEEKTIHDILDELREDARHPTSKGFSFEDLTVAYLRKEPQYAELFSDVWLWDEWPDNGDVSDYGIDIVARERVSGDYWAIQCKFFDSVRTLYKGDLDSFIATSGVTFATREGKFRFARRLVVTTAQELSSTTKKLLEGQEPPVYTLFTRDLEASAIDWGQFSKHRKIAVREKKALRPHQTEAVGKVVAGFKEHDRGKMIMACGTGKTLTSLRLAEKMAGNGGQVLFLLPSLSLVAQTLREWTAEAEMKMHALIVCSDDKIGRARRGDSEDIFVRDIVHPATTDAETLARYAKQVSADRCRVVFSTYQSLKVVREAQKKHGLGEFDLVVCDEAHRTSGVLEAEDESGFLMVHENENIRAKKRLYMTATPRVYGEKSAARAEENEVQLFSMDDEEKFGPEFYRLGFGESVRRGLLSDYKVLIVVQEEMAMAGVANRYNLAVTREKERREEAGERIGRGELMTIDLNFAAKIIGSWKGMSKYRVRMLDKNGAGEEMAEDTATMRRVVAFTRTIKNSRQVEGTFSKLVNLYRSVYSDAQEQEWLDGMVNCEIRHVDGTMGALKRAGELDWLKKEREQEECRVLTNARCLAEGVDVPALDGVIFFDTRDSMVDIVQAVGRVMRKAAEKQYGYIVLPVCIPASEVGDYDEFMENNERFRNVWRVIKALRSHDERLVYKGVYRETIEVIPPEPDPEPKPEQGVLPLDIQELERAVYAAMPRKLGDQEYWSEWAKEVARIAARVIERIKDLLENSEEAKSGFKTFMGGLHKNLNPHVGEEEAVEMLAQHIVTRPVFDALFKDHSFVKDNRVSKAMEGVVAVLDKHAVGSEVESLNAFYDSVRERMSGSMDAEDRQEIIRRLYDSFFRYGFPLLAQRLGIVYTPIAVVDFILNSADFALRKHFGTNMSSSDVQVLDPFTGTGIFMVRLLNSDLIGPEDLARKYQNELHANEIVLLAYYIASINIESAFERRSGGHQPFSQLVFTDTFQMTEEGDLVDKVVFPENIEQVREQSKRDIRVIIGNPPYKAWQRSENDANPNVKYPTLDGRIRDSYAAQSSAMHKGSLYDSYIRAIRWSTDRLNARAGGIIAFVTNGSFIDGNAADGLRKCLTGDFSHLYVFNLRGDARTSGEKRKTEGGNIFGGGSRAQVAITVMVKDPSHQGECELRYHDIGDSLTREKKLAVIKEFGCIEKIDWQRITPDESGDWINQRDPAFDKFVSLGDKKKGEGAAGAVFNTYSRGVATGRDFWSYNTSRGEVEANMHRMIANYNKGVERWQAGEEVIDQNPRNISWTRGLKKNLRMGKTFEFDANKITVNMYRPFAKQWLYFDASRGFNEEVYLLPKLFPTSEHENIVILLADKGGSQLFSALATDFLPDLHTVSPTQCFPLYQYEKAGQDRNGRLNEAGSGEAPDAHGYERRDGISDWALAEFRGHYGDDSISKEDLFWYIYGVFHSPEYRTRFEANLRKEIPRIPFAGDFRAFSKAGKALGDLHLNYETAAPYALTEDTGGKLAEIMSDKDYKVRKMKFGRDGKEKDKTSIVYNDTITLRGIPPEAYGYVVNGKSAIEWIMDRYQVRTDKDSGIRNDPNDWAPDNPRYILDLLKRIVTVSVESVKIINALPPLDEHKD
ncbi:MAG: DEAD/DEAH box helicase family protein [Alphaproteobacteria bacterium]|nr:DEAD/DEAH box helicase family protein [Alphaproteobacteria bacterium]MDA7988077.1 DEAD/DEAH box helicase family protein [Alphaproteobacteria bacterium]MDA8009109.1 DEAD/DEAH box helicase family protein [Alphaproteobacteria bacterium]